MEKDVSILTEKQRIAWTRHENGEPYSKIARDMGLSAQAVANHVHNAERRFREYERYKAHEEWNNAQINLVLTNAECEILVQGLLAYEDKMMKTAHFTGSGDWRSRLPYEAQRIPPLLDKLQQAVYGESRYRSTLIVCEMQNDLKKSKA